MSSCGSASNTGAAADGPAPAAGHGCQQRRRQVVGDRRAGRALAAPGERAASWPPPCRWPEQDQAAGPVPGPAHLGGQRELPGDGPGSCSANWRMPRRWWRSAAAADAWTRPWRAAGRRVLRRASPPWIPGCAVARARVGQAITAAASNCARWRWRSLSARRRSCPIIWAVASGHRPPLRPGSPEVPR